MEEHGVHEPARRAIDCLPGSERRRTLIIAVWPGVTVLALVLLFAAYAFVDTAFEGARAFSSQRVWPVLGHLVLALIDLAAGLVAVVRRVFKAEGLDVITTLPKTPRMNAICERVIGTLRREPLDPQ